MVHFVLPPDHTYSDRQLAALAQIEERAAVWRASPKGVDFIKRRNAAKKGLRKKRSTH